DLNNYCKAEATLEVTDGRIYPSLLLNPNPAGGGKGHIDCGADFADLNVDVANMTTALTYTWGGGPFDVQDKGRNAKKYNPNRPGDYGVVVENTVTGRANVADSVEVTTGLINSRFGVSVNNGYAPLTVEFTNLSSSLDSVSGQANIQSIWNFDNGKYL